MLLPTRPRAKKAPNKNLVQIADSIENQGEIVDAEGEANVNISEGESDGDDGEPLTKKQRQSNENSTTPKAKSAVRRK